jgi:hypothetical protein
VSAIRPLARVGAGLAAAIVLVVLTPGAARAASCPLEGPLQAYQREPVAFVGQVIERRDATVVMSVVAGFKGVSSDTVVEIVDDDGFFARPMPAPPDSVSPTLEYGVLASTAADGRLHTGDCRIMSPQDLGAAFRANREGRSCAPPPPRVRRIARTLRGRDLSLRVVVAHGVERAHTVEVQWGAPDSRGRLPRTTKLVPASRTLVLRHRYRKRRKRAVTVLITVAARPPLLCGLETPSSSRSLRIRV